MRSFLTIILFVAMFACTTTVSAFLGMNKTLEGSIGSINGDTLAIISEKNDGQQIVEVKVNSETQFEDEASSFDTLKQGDMVKVEFMEEDETNIALSISLVPAEEVAEIPVVSSL